jgi:protein-S-isoprenylcysteine O-methyltransferase Ste14
MAPGHGQVLFFAALVASVVIRIPHDRRNRTMAVKESRKTTRERLLLGFVAFTGLLLPILASTPLLAFTDHTLPVPVFAAGAVTVVAWLWLFHRAHADLGQNWSPTLEVREQHQLITRGVYAKIRHPMYTSLFLHAAAQALLIPNWIGGPAMFVGFGSMFVLRLGPEEEMMLETFGDAYRAYQQKTKRLIPFVW